MIRAKVSALTTREYKRLPKNTSEPCYDNPERPRNISAMDTAYTRLVHRVAPGEKDRYASLPKYIVNPTLNKNVVWIR